MELIAIVFIGLAAFALGVNLLTSVASVFDLLFNNRKK